jgi:hypothetical protein
MRSWLRSRMMSFSSRSVARGLSGYLCGTHSGLLRRSSSTEALSGGAAPAAIAAAHRRLAASTANRPEVELGGRVWRPPGSSSVDEALNSALSHPGVIDLVLFGSQARGRVTGFSDIDAILVLTDEVVDEARELSSLRRSVLAAQRAVVSYQPMQHHGFEVATPKLLRDASGTLALPAIALAVTRSLKGRTVVASFSDEAGDGAVALRTLVKSVLSFRRWPAHPWEAHRLVAMFELLPTLYLQSRGRVVAKPSSFAEARAEFGKSWWPYDVLDEIRAVWPRRRRPILEIGAAIARNPWAAIAAWRRMPVSVPDPVRSLLTPRLIDGLQTLARAMAR